MPDHTDPLEPETGASMPETTPFPRIRKRPGIRPNDTLAEAGRKIMRFHFAHMLKHEQGTLSGVDVEELHDMRVATRRMRAAFELFGPFFKSKAVKKQRKGLRTTGRALGHVRDLDVFLEKAQRYRESLPEVEREGLAPLLEEWHRERASEHEKLTVYLESKDYQQFKQSFNMFISEAEETERYLETEPGPGLVRHILPSLIYSRLASVQAYEGLIPRAGVTQLHALRIECKKLRYTLEFFREVLGAEARDVIEEIKSLQDHLGDLNDANVACGILEEVIERMKATGERKNLNPLKAYLAAKRAEQYSLMKSFPPLWEHFNRREMRKAVAQSVSEL